MSIVERAIKKLSDAGHAGRGNATPRPPVGKLEQRSAAPVAVPVTRTLRVDREKIIRSGVLAHADEHVELRAELRHMKRPLLNNLPTAASPVERGNIIAVTSALPGAGKTFVAMNLACALAGDKDLKVVLIDTDVMHPSLSEAFGLRDEKGLMDLLREPTQDVFGAMIETDLNGLMLMPIGVTAEDSIEYLTNERFTQFCTMLSERLSGWLVVMDGPPLLVTSESRAVSAAAGQVLFVVEAGSSTENTVTSAIDLLDRSKPINLVMNKCRGLIGGDSYGYGSYSYGEAGAYRPR